MYMYMHVYIYNCLNPLIITNEIITNDVRKWSSSCDRYVAIVIVNSEKCMQSLLVSKDQIKGNQ